MAIPTYSTPVRLTYPGGKESRYYYVRAYDPTKKTSRWVSTRCEKLHAAKEWVKRRQRVEERGAERQFTRLTLSEALSMFLDRKRQAKKTRATIRQYEGQARMLLSAVGDKRTIDITEDDLLRFFKARDKTKVRGQDDRGVAPRTYNRDRNFVRMFMRWAEGKGCVVRGLTEDIEPRRQPERAIRTLTAEEEQRLFAACLQPYRQKVVGMRNAAGRKGGRSRISKKGGWSQEFRPPEYLYGTVLCALRTGLRHRNVVDLEWREVDLEEDVLRVAAEKMKAQRDLEIPLHPELKDYLLSLREKKIVDRMYVFPEARGADFQKVFKNAVRRAGIRRCRFHDLRATACTWLCKVANPKVVQVIMGHKRLETTLRYYVNVTMDDMRKGIDKLRAPEVRPDHAGR